MTSPENGCILVNHPVHVASPAPRMIWESVLTKDPNVLVDQTPDWLDCICAAGSYKDASRLYEIPNRGTFILPMVRSRFVPGFMASIHSLPPSWGTGGIIGNVSAQQIDVEIILKDLISLPGLRILIRPSPLANAAWKNVRGTGITVVSRRAHALDLRGGFDHIWNHKFDKKTRNLIRKAESNGLTIECDKTGMLVPVFYQLFEQSVSRWAEQQHEPQWLARQRAHRRDPIAKFEMIAKRMKSACRIWVAWYQNEPAAAILILQGTNAHYIRGVMNMDIAGPTKANDLLQRYAIEDACQSGCGYYYMGDSGQSASIAHFKHRFGAEAIPYAEYHLERLPITQVDAKLRGLVKRVIGFRDV